MRTIIAILLLETSLGCGSKQQPPPAEPIGETRKPAPSAKPQNQKPGDNPSQSNINISDEIKKACGITDAEAFFAFDSANVRPEDQAIFGKLAKCFASGPLSGKNMQLVGHADPRGEDEYNMLLGERRAGNVKTAISGAGLGKDKILTTSRGKLDATGTDEASWAKDRRVDVQVAH
ncbi:MAG TPA: OmpA family protein [Polyangiaceae bacterium]|jgi:peptidoglycan-associated lipoprotein